MTAIRSNDSSDDENDTDDGTISGENDVEYAEFSLSVRTSPKEQIVNRNGNASTAPDELNNMPRSQKPKRSTATMEAGQRPNDEFMIMPMASERNDISMPSNLPGSSIVKLFNVHAMNNLSNFNLFLAVRNRYRTPITSASVLETLLEPPKSNETASLLAKTFLPGGSSSSESSSTESLRSTEHNVAHSSEANAIASSNIDGEAISWNWNPHQSASLQSDRKLNPTSTRSQYDDYLARISNDYYDRTLDKLMGEFSLSKRKRNWDRNLSRHCANDVDDNMHRSQSEYDSSVWPTAHAATAPSTARHGNDLGESARNNDVKDVNFWTNVFFSGDTTLPDAPRKSNGKNPTASETVNEIASMPSTSSATHRPIDGKAKKVDNMRSSNTAYLLNNVISKLNEPSTRSGRATKSDSTRPSAAQSKYEFEPISRRTHDASNHFSFSGTASDSLLTLPPSYTLLNVIKPRSLLPKRKNHSSSYAGESEHMTTAIADATSTQRYPAAANSTFLQTINELQFDHNGLFPASSTALASPQSASRQRENAGQSKQKER